MRDADRGHHEEWCDTQNKISEHCNCMADGYIQQIDDLTAKLAIATAALGFYAGSPVFTSHDGHSYDSGSLENDRGERARTALAKIKETP